MGCRSAVHDPRGRPLNRHLIEGGNQAGLIPDAWRPVRRGTGRGGELGGREGSVRLWRRHGWCTPLLLRRPLGGQGL